jgi:hypothetical protein
MRASPSRRIIGGNFWNLFLTLRPSSRAYWCTADKSVCVQTARPRWNVSGTRSLSGAAGTTPLRCSGHTGRYQRRTSGAPTGPTRRPLCPDRSTRNWLRTTSASTALLQYEIARQHSRPEGHGLFEVRAPIGAGGSGEVYKARDTARPRCRGQGL